MKKINLLPENLINQIAAGEVIERPASVVKELVENSIDAGATRIEIEITNSCRNIRIADNGSGIDREDVALAFSRHATSKLSSAKDLFDINTLGFRGEALASIISVAKVTCITKTADADVGVKVECENSEITVSDIGCANGTTMQVEELFYNIPARLKFMKKNSTELSAISEAVQSMALANSHVSFNLISNGKSILKTTGTSDIAVAIGEVYSKNIISEFQEVQKEDVPFGLEITGYVSNPDFVRSNRKAIYLFINGRTVKCPIMLKAIDTVYRTMIPSGKHPYAVLNLSIPQKEIDVNVHPAKREVRYKNTNLIFNFVYSAVKHALDLTASYQPVIEQEPQEEYTYNAPVQNNTAIAEERPNVVNFNSYPKQIASAQQETLDIEPDDIQEVVVKQNQFELSQEDEREIIEKPRIIGQFNNTYVLIQADDGLQVIDQHIAHERYLYEKLKEERSQASQMLMISETIDLEEEQVVLIQENTELLAKYGYEFNFISATQVKLKRVPQIVAQKDPSKVVEDVIDALETSADMIEDELLTRTSCRAAVKAGEKLSIWQMEELIINWKKTKNPRTCPHGRIISHIIPTKEIAGFFGRAV